MGNWGGEATRWRFDAVQDGNVVRSVTLCPSAKLHLEVKVSRTTLREQDTYDMAAVRVRILDENGAPAPYAQFPVQFTVDGSAALVGPADRRGRRRHDRHLSAHCGHCRRSRVDRFCTADPARCAAVHH